MDTDIIIKNDINVLFNACEDEILYVLEEGDLQKQEIEHNYFYDYHGRPLFTYQEVAEMKDSTAFTSGIMLFKNCVPIKTLFDNIKKHIASFPYVFSTFDQPFIVYNAFKYNLFNNKVLKDFCLNVGNASGDINSDKIIHHFCGGPGIPQNKIVYMESFLFEIKSQIIDKKIDITKKYITKNLLSIIINSEEKHEGNIFMTHHTTKFSDVFLDKAKNLSNLVLNKTIKNVLEIGFNSGFSTLLMLLTNPNINITCCDLGEHSYALPCYRKIKEDFGDRINIIIGDSVKTLPTISNKFDIIHIDGGHQTMVAENDIKIVPCFDRL